MVLSQGGPLKTREWRPLCWLNHAVSIKYNNNNVLHHEGRERGWGCCGFGISVPRMLIAPTPHPPFGHLLPQGEKGGLETGEPQGQPSPPEGEGGSAVRPRRVRGLPPQTPAQDPNSA